jgi:hypothetical protein
MSTDMIMRASPNRRAGLMSGFRSLQRLFLSRPPDELFV